jgi:hypothetical protein
MNWENQVPSIFLSYSSKDLVFVCRLAKRLSKDGVRVWLDKADLKIGDSLIHRISEAVEQADFVGAVISHNSITSSWVQKELSMAVAKEIYTDKVVVLPILIDQCDLPDFLKDKLYADFTDRKEFNKAYVKLRETLYPEFLWFQGMFEVRGMRARPYRSGFSSFKFKRARVMIYWHDLGLTKSDALDLISFLDDIGVEGVMARHSNASTPDAVFISQKADQEIVRDVLSALPYDIKYIFPLNYPDPECGASSEFVISVGLHSTHRQSNRPKTEEPKPIDEKALTILLDEELPKDVFKIMLQKLAGNK